MYSGEGVGEGAKRAVIADLVNKKTKDVTLCKAVNSEMYYTLATRKAPISPSQYEECRAFGFLNMLFMATFELAPDPTSPSLIQWACGGLDSLIDLCFVGIYAPETASKLAAWPVDPNTCLVLDDCITGTNPLTNLIIEHLEMLVSCFYLHIHTPMCQLSNDVNSRVNFGGQTRHSENPTSSISTATNCLGAIFLSSTWDIFVRFEMV